MTNAMRHESADGPPTPLRDAGLLTCPEHVAEAILARTRRVRTTVVYRFPRWALPLASAAVLAIAVAGVWLAARSAQSRHSEADLHALAADLRLVFASAGDALSRGQQAALDDVLSRQVAPAVQQAPIGFSQSHSDSQGNGL